MECGENARELKTKCCERAMEEHEEWRMKFSCNVCGSPDCSGRC